MIVFEIIACAAALVTIVGVILAVGKWVARLDANTGATERLTEVFEHFVEKVSSTLTNHGDRLTRLETRYEYWENGTMKSAVSTQIAQPPPVLPDPKDL